MSGVATAIVGGAIIGGVVQDSASKRGIKSQEDASARAESTQERMYEQQREDLAPWREAGTGALEQMQSGDIQAQLEADPGYQFRMQQGMGASNAAASARGGSLGGAQLKALNRYGQDYASQEYGNSWNRLSTLAGLGSSANQQGVSAAGQLGTNMANNQMSMGNAQAAAQIAQGNQMSNMIGQGTTAYAMYASDERLKTDIKPVNKEDLAELRAAIKPYAYKYINSDLGEGEFIGVMAQDLEKTKLGKTIIEEIDGFKFVNMKKATSLFLASIAEG